MDTQNVVIKGTLIFGILGFTVFIILIVAGMVMNALGFQCNCYKVFAWSLIGVAILSGTVFWYGVCFGDDENGECRGVEGHKRTLERMEGDSN